MVYVDGFVLPVPKENIAAYKKIATKAGKIWKNHGALEYYECVGEDLFPTAMKTVMTFPKMAKVKEEETVVFSWIVFRSRKHRDAVNKKVMADPRMNDMMPDGPQFDYKRMAYGGFETIVKL